MRIDQHGKSTPFRAGGPTPAHENIPRCMEGAQSGHKNFWYDEDLGLHLQRSGACSTTTGNAFKKCNRNHV